MDYEKKYKELIEKIELISRSALTVEQHQIVDTILGELKESEDERVRKALLEMVHDTTGDELWVDYNVHKEDALAWLEKQGEHAKFRDSIQVGDKVTRNEDGVLVNLSQLNRVAKKDEKQSEQKPAWSKEDEVKINRIVACLENLNVADNDILLKDVDWLKSLRPQNNITDEELAQAKKDAYNDALDKIEYHSGEPTFDDGWSAAIWYLKKKNAMPQTQWKPSDEQMEALKHYVDTTMDGDIDLLYQDLKELKGE